MKIRYSVFLIILFAVITVAYSYMYNQTSRAEVTYAKENESMRVISNNNHKEVNPLRYDLIELRNELVIAKESLELNFNTDFEAAKFTISAYSPYDDQNGINSDGDPNTTATGTKPGPGTFAVDPSVIPYGSDVTIIYPDGMIERGVAEDTGGAIVGNRIDVFRWAYGTAMSFGMKDAVVIWEEKQ